MSSKSKGTQPPESVPPAAPEKRGRGHPRGSKNSAPTPKWSRAKAPPNTERVAFSITEFCHRNNISDGAYTNLRKAGLGPREMRPSGVPYGTVLISLAAEAEWQLQCEQRVVSEEAKAANREKRTKARAAKKPEDVS